MTTTSTVETLLDSPPGTGLQLRPSQIAPSPDNPRHVLGDLEGLTTSIRERGVQQPITVFRTPPPDDLTDQAAVDGYMPWTVLDGHRRHAASIDAGVATIPALVVDVPTDTSQARIDRMVANLHRLDLTPRDETDAFAALVDEGLTQREIAEQVGVNQSHISKRLQLRHLPDAAWPRVTDGELTVEHALTLARITKHDQTQGNQLADANHWQIDQEWREIERDKKRSKAHAKAVRAHAAGKGLPVVALEAKVGQYSSAPDGTVRHGDWSWDRDYNGTRDKLETAGDLAVWIDSNGSRVEVCTNPKKYAKPATATRNKPDPWQQATGKRLDWIADHIGSGDHTPPDVGTALVSVATLYVASRNGDELKMVTELLGLDLPKSAGQSRRRDVLVEWLTSGPNPQDAAAMLVGILEYSTPERDLAYGAWGTPEPTQVAYFDRLTTAGYQPSKAEQDWLAKADDATVAAA